VVQVFVIPITGSVAKQTDIYLPGRTKVWSLVAAYKSGLAGTSSSVPLDPKGDGSATESPTPAVKLQADGRKFKYGAALTNADVLTLVGVVSGSVQGCGE